MKTATTTLGVDGGGILELSRDGRNLTVVAGADLPDGMVGSHQILLSESANAGYTLRTGEPTIVEDMAAETRFKPAPFLLELGVVSSVTVPIQGLGRASGSSTYGRASRAGSQRTTWRSSARSRRSSRLQSNVIATSRRRATRRCTTHSQTFRTGRSRSTGSPTR